MKKIVLVFVILLLCGCSAEYDLKINDKGDFNENTKILVSNYDLNKKYYDDLWPVFEYYCLNEVPLSIEEKPNDFVPYTNLNNINVYDKKINYSDSDITLKLSGTFSKNRIYIDNSAVANYFGNINVSENNGITSLGASIDSSVFDNYYMLDNITVNVSSNYSIMNSNADKVSRGIYTWIITRNNCDDKSISFSLNTKNKSKTVFKENNNIQISVILLFGFLICGLLFFIFKYIHNKNNHID